MNRNILLSGLIVLSLIIFNSCSSDRATVDMTIKGLHSSRVEIKRHSINLQIFIDSVMTDDSGHFKYTIRDLDTTPDFYYFYYKESAAFQLLLKAGESVTLEIDTLGNLISIEGSSESLLLSEVERSIKKSSRVFDSLMTLYNLTLENHDAERERELNYELGSLYVKTKQAAIRHLISHPKSLTALPLIYYRFSNGLPLFNNTIEDRALTKSIADSLSSRYPSSPYCKLLVEKIVRAENEAKLNEIIDSAEEVGFLDLSLPDINSVPRKLSDLKNNAILLWFWTATNADQKMLNQEFKELYERYSGAGLEIYQVCVDKDKTAWAQIVKAQNLPWISVCDGLGTSSPAVISYNVTSVPKLFIISKKGNIVTSFDLSNSDFKGQLDKAIKESLK